MQDTAWLDVYLSHIPHIGAASCMKLGAQDSILTCLRCAVYQLDDPADIPVSQPQLLSGFVV